MNVKKYIGMDVHKETISIAMMTGDGKLVMESIIETKASTILQFVQGLQGDLHVTFEEGTWAAWLYDLMKPHVRELLVCDPRKNALLKDGNKSDKIDARKEKCPGYAVPLRYAFISPPVRVGCIGNFRSRDRCDVHASFGNWRGEGRVC